MFAPQGSFHYFENRGPADMKIVIVQNTSAPEDKDNIGIGESLSRLPPRVLSAVFGVPQRRSAPSKRSVTRSSSCDRPSQHAAVVRPRAQHGLFVIVVGVWPKDHLFTSYNGDWRAALRTFT